jgi:hypothetical protein
VFLCGDFHRFVYSLREEHLLPKQKAIGHGFFLRATTRPSRSPYCSGATLRVRLCDALFFLHVTSTYGKHAPVTSLLDLPLVSGLTFIEGVLASLESGHVGGSSGNDNALSSLQVHGPNLQRLDVHLRTC